MVFRTSKLAVIADSPSNNFREAHGKVGILTLLVRIDMCSSYESSMQLTQTHVSDVHSPFCHLHSVSICISHSRLSRTLVRTRFYLHVFQSFCLSLVMNSAPCAVLVDCARCCLYANTSPELQGGWSNYSARRLHFLYLIRTAVAHQVVDPGCI